MRVIRDEWLVKGNLRNGELHGQWETRRIRLSEVFERWERAGIDFGRPFTVTVDTIGQCLTAEQEEAS